MAEDLLTKTAIIQHYVMETKSGIVKIMCIPHKNHCSCFSVMQLDFTCKCIMVRPDFHRILPYYEACSAQCKSGTNWFLID